MNNYLTAMALLQHVRNLNAKVRAWVAEDPSNRWAAYPIVDLKLFHSWGVFTPEDFDRYEMWNEAYEFYKTVHGIKPRWWAGWQEWSIEELKAQMERLSEDFRMEEEYAREQQERKLQEERDHKAAYAAALTPTPAWTIGDLMPKLA